MSGQDLGTYHIKVYLKNSEAFIQKWSTGGRYTSGAWSNHPIDATWIPPFYKNEKELIRNMTYMFTEGNYSCDCNLGDFLAQSKQEEDPDLPCGDTLYPQKLVIRRPSGTHKVIWEEK